MDEDRFFNIFTAKLKGKGLIKNKKKQLPVFKAL